MSKEVLRIPKMSVHKDELETGITIDPAEKTAFICSTIPNMIKKMYQWVENHDEAEIDLDNSFCLGITVPMSWVHVRPAIQRKTTKRQMTEEEKAALIERLQRARETKKRAL